MQIQPIGVPYDLNRFAQRMGRTPAAILPRLGRQAGLAEPVVVSVADLGGDEVADVARIQAAVAAAVRAARSQGCLPLLIGGDCTVALGAMAGLQGAVSGLVWIDAHGDFNTPAISPSGYLGGMPLATIAGRGLAELRIGAGLAHPFPEAQIALVGVRDLDPLERAALSDSAVTVLSSDNLRDPSGVLVDTICQIGGSGPLYLHLDVDVLDPSEMPGVVYPTPGGLRLAELQTLLRLTREQCRIGGITLTAVNIESLAEAEQERALQAAEALLDEILLLADH